MSYKTFNGYSYEKSAAIFCHWVAAWVLDTFCNFYFLKINKIANNSTTSEAVEKNKSIYRIIRISEIFDKI
jgi:hypothetical protein